MKKRIVLAVSSALILVGLSTSQAVAKTAPINACKAAIDEEIDVSEVSKRIKLIKDKGSSLLITYKIKYVNTEGEQVKQTAKCHAHDNGEILDLTIE